MFWKKSSLKSSPRDGQLIIVIGATRSGKTTYAKKLVGNARNVVVCTISPVWEYREITNINDWKAYKGGRVRITTFLFDKEFSPSMLLWKRGYILVLDDAPAIISSRSNLNWDKVLLTFRNHSITVIYISQTFRKIPRHVLANADYFVVGYLPNIYDEERYLSDIYGTAIKLPTNEPFKFKIFKVRK
ncbi:MAG: hypothetical protein ABIL50_05690 [candidate division WOR-3 bacterium]